MERTMKLSIMDDIFLNYRQAFDKVLNGAMGVNERHELEGFKLSVTLDFSLPRISVSDEFSPTNELRTTIMPNVAFKLSATLQQKIKAEGRLPNNFELAFDSLIGAIVFRKIDDGQTSLFDEDTGLAYHVDERGSVSIDYIEDKADEQED